jgi:hypothetical protein
VGPQVHVGGVEPDEERRARLVLAVDEVQAVLEDLVVDGLHPLLGQRAGVLDPLPADPAPAGLVGVVVVLGGPAVQHPAGPEPLPEVGEVLGGRVVGRLRVLLGVQVVEVAEELVEAVHGRQVLVLVAEVVLAELTGGIAQRLEQLGDGRVLGLQPDRRRRDAHLGEAGAEHALPGDERRPPGRAALLAVGVGEAHPLLRDPVDVRGPVAHQPVAVTAQVGDADVVSPDDQDVRPLPVRHLALLAHGSSAANNAASWAMGHHPAGVNSAG